MYIAKLINGEITTEIHGVKEKLKSGNVVKGINTIDSFSFSILPSNKGFNRIFDKVTLVTVYNTNKKRYEFIGRVLNSRPAMEESGLITKEVTCESYFGFMCDSKQKYIPEQNWTVVGLLEHIINCHNSQLEDYKHFTIGEVTVTDPNDNLYVGIQRENTWKTIEEKLIKKLGGEIRFRVVDGVTYLDYLTEIGSTRSTEIKLSKNMISVSQEDDSSAYITRLIPLGCKLSEEQTTTDDEGNETTQTVETEERLDITSVNDGVEYIEDEDAREVYGINVEYVYFDDVTDASNLFQKGREYMAENNRVKRQYTVNALDLSLLGLDIDDFDVHNYHPIVNPLLGIDDTARIIKKNIDICKEVGSTIDLGEILKTLSDIQIEQAGQIKDAINTIEKIEGDYVTNEKLTNETLTLTSLIHQTAEDIILMIEESYVSISGNEQFKQELEAKLEVLSEKISLNFTETTTKIEEVNGELQSTTSTLSKYFDFTIDGLVIKSGESAITLHIDNDMIMFKKNGVMFGWWDGVDFHTGNIVVEVNERAQFGNFAFVPRSDGSLAFLKVDNEVLANKLIAISVTYTGGDVMEGTALEDLTGITVTATYSDGSTEEVTDYTLTGTIAEGENTIAVTYGEKTARFVVNGIADAEIVLGEATTCVVAAWLSGVTGVISASVTYADEVEVVDGEVVLVNEKSTTFYRLSSTYYDSSQCAKLPGKYVTSTSGSIYYIDPESTYEQKTNVSTYVAENIKYNTAYLVSVAE